MNNDNITQAAANKAAEEGGLPALPEEEFICEPGIYGHTADQMRAYALEAIAADRASRQVDLTDYSTPVTCTNTTVISESASRQVANKADVDLSSLRVYACTDSGMQVVAKDTFVCEYFATDEVEALLAIPPATTGASTAPRPTDDELWDATLRDRDAYHEWADKLAGAISKHFAVDIGEHSNQNLPWAEALEAIENAEPVGASTVLTDERIEWILRDLGVKAADRGEPMTSIDFARAIEREVAAQAGQVAVPGHPTEEMLNAARDWSLKKYGQGIGNDAAIGCWKAMYAAAPSPAKESK